jgi:hypothetical protein
MVFSLVMGNLLGNPNSKKFAVCSETRTAPQDARTAIKGQRTGRCRKAGA